MLHHLVRVDASRQFIKVDPMKPKIAYAGLLVCLLWGASAEAQDFTLDMTTDPTPDGMINLTIVIPIDLRDVHPHARTLTISCNLKTETGNAIGPIGTAGVNLLEIPAGADGYRDVSRDLAIELSLTLVQFRNVSSYRCFPNIYPDPDETGEAPDHALSVLNGLSSEPYWARGIATPHSLTGRLIRPTP